MKERQRELKTKTQFKIITLCTYKCAQRALLYESLKGLTEVLTSTPMLITELLALTPKIITT